MFTSEKEYSIIAVGSIGCSFIGGRNEFMFAIRVPIILRFARRTFNECRRLQPVMTMCALRVWPRYATVSGRILAITHSFESPIKWL